MWIWFVPYWYYTYPFLLFSFNGNCNCYSFVKCFYRRFYITYLPMWISLFHSCFALYQNSQNVCSDKIHWDSHAHTQCSGFHIMSFVFFLLFHFLFLYGSFYLYFIISFSFYSPSYIVDHIMKTGWKWTQRYFYCKFKMIDIGFSLSLWYLHVFLSDVLLNCSLLFLTLSGNSIHIHTHTHVHARISIMDVCAQLNIWRWSYMGKKGKGMLVWEQSMVFYDFILY